MERSSLHKPAVPDLIAGYAPLPGVADELIDETGALRRVWLPLIDYLSQLSQEEIEEHFARGSKYLRDAGVYFRQYTTTTPTPEHDWPLNPVPVIIDGQEWTEICAGLAQRADLLEQVMADLYGPAQLVSDGHLPAELVAQSKGWLRPLVGVRPASEFFLHLMSFEISRNPDGSWFVLGDRVQAPSGAGFALENRIATTRTFNDLFARSNVLRLAQFFRSFRTAMDSLPGGNNRGSAILTPGPNNASYYEHTYVARYLGLLLLQGEDLLVRDNQVMVRTVEGLEPLGAIWRRVDSEFMDPLELREDSQLGTPGLVNALRHGAVNMINSMGAGVLEMRAMMAFLPKISNVVTGQPLSLPNIATWWCGQPSERDFVKANLDRMMIGGALDQNLPFDVDATTALGDRVTDRARISVEDWIDREGAFLVGQEMVTLSTAPAYQDGVLVPRPMTVRVTAARTQNGWEFMPGGYARFGSSDDATALAMQSGGAVSDVWVVSDAPVKKESLLQRSQTLRAQPEPLPSRAAENFYWLGRYAERAETAFRLVRAYHLRLAETGDPDEPSLQRLATYMEAIGIDTNEVVPQGLVHQIDAARSCAGKVRDRFSTDGWAALQDLSKTIHHMTDRAQMGDECARAMGVLLRKITGFSGLVQENMYRFVGWRFLALGRALERCDTLASVLVAFADDDLQSSADIAIELGDSTISHRRIYVGEATRLSAMDLLASDEQNPRSILFQLNEMVTLAERLPRQRQASALSPITKMLLPLQTQFAVTDPVDLSDEDLQNLRRAMADVSDRLSTDYLR